MAEVRPKRHPDTVVKRVQKMYESGETLLSISRETRLGFTTIYHWGKSLGWRRPQDNRGYSKSQRKQCRELFVKRGFSIMDIARHMNIWPGTLYKWKHEEGW